MVEYFQYFKNKACTVCTVELNFRFKEEQMMDYFTGIVEIIDTHGIWLLHPITKCRSYILFKHIVAVSEEQILDENNPEHAKIIAEYREKKPLTAAKRTVTAESQLKEPQFVDPTALAKMAQKAKEDNEAIRP
ncbi:MAG: hypothetical protein GTO02_08995 [Candidatus Dadabacteria bacterium]|nr:hypothetical protein [Candidatus Dadabacteria bacterium]